MVTFFDEIKNARTEKEKIFAQYRLVCALALKRRIVSNIDSTFGGRVKGDRDIKAGRRGGRSGALRQSVAVDVVGDLLKVTVGNANVPYAAIHEYGGVIYPKNAKYLTIPLADEYRGKRAGEFSTLTFFENEKNNKFLYDSKEERYAYLLRRSVKIPERPYIRPAIKTFIDMDSRALWERIK